MTNNAKIGLRPHGGLDPHKSCPTLKARDSFFDND
jgi:hypothetical protein